MRINVGTAGWAIARDAADQFPVDGSSLERYASRFLISEINSSFHRPHRLSTWERWRDSVPDDFRFSVKLPKTITHQAKLVGCGDLLRDFVEQAKVLGNKLAVLLVQLPPKLELDIDGASNFFEDLRSRTSANIACEPRNASWFTDQANELLTNLRVARVAADPGICAAGAAPGGWRGLSYWRLHGSPQIYRSSYSYRLPVYAAAIRNAAESRSECWCIFDNTASSAAIGDALGLTELLRG